MSTFSRQNIILTIGLGTITLMLNSINRISLQQALIDEPPFNYSLNITVYPATTDNADVLIYLHGAGSNIKEAKALYKKSAVPHHIVTFNFPDANTPNFDLLNLDTATFGTINELLPALYVLKRCVIDANLTKIHVCGFSAGGGALINAIGVLHGSDYDTHLAAIGISTADKNRILAALQQGHIILNCPLKSIEEIIDALGSSLILDTLAARYTSNQFRPIDALNRITGLPLTVLLHFQENDTILSNRDDHIFYLKLKAVVESSQGSVIYVRGDDGGHLVYHASLWKTYTTWQ